MSLADRFEESLAVDALAVAINETDERQGLWEVVGYFAGSAEAEKARDILDAASAAIASLPQANWVAYSLKGLAPVVAGRFFLYGAHDIEKRRQAGVSLQIDAGTAFGTGHHGTTAGCLFAFDVLLKRAKPKRILDLGCGTGVLGIAAAAALKRTVVATDIDPEAVRVTRLNAARAGVAPLVRSFAAAGLADRRFSETAPYDLIFANILARPLISLAPGLTRALAPGGTLILSGITRDQLRWIEAVYRSLGAIIRERRLLGNWATLVFEIPRKMKSPERFRSGRIRFSA